MQKIEMFILDRCPYCREALGWQKELMRPGSVYEGIPVEIVDEEIEAERAGRLDYYYVPTYYVGGVKLHEGAASREKVKAVLDAALETGADGTPRHG